MKIKCLIIDDEPIARDVIRAHLEKLDDFEIASEHENALEALSFLKQNRIDLIFLDINMPRLSGLDFLRSLKSLPKTIITTAYREFALDGFDLHVVDYLLKPIAFERFLQAIDKYYESLSYPITINSAETPISRDAFIYLRDNRKTHKVYLADISIIESMGEYIKVHCGKKKVMTRCSLSMIERSLPSDRFIRTHNSFIVSIAHITAFTASTVEVGETEIPISRKYKNSKIDMMNKKIFWIFGILQNLTLGIILFLIFRSFNLIHGESVIGLDTQIFLCIAFPLFSLLVKYTIYTKT